MPGAFDAIAFDEYAFDVDYTTSSALFLSVAGVERATDRVDESAKVLHGSLTVVDILNETPNTCSFTTKGFAPQVGQRVLIALGGATNPSRLFAGTILTCKQSYVGTPSNAIYEVSCADDTWKLGQVKVTVRYTAMSATDIAIDLIDTYAPDFDTTDIEAALDDIDEITFTNETLTTCLTRLAQRIGGYWYVDEFESIHFFVTDTATDPDSLTTSNPPIAGDVANPFTVDRDVSQMITRVLGEGGGAVALSDLAVGETEAPIASTEYFNELGGAFVSGPQRCTYTGIAVGGSGSLVGPGFAPSTAPTLELADGAGVTSGLHDVTVVHVTGAGRSIASPVASITVGSVAAPAAAPTPGAPTSGGSVDPGDHDYEMTLVTAVGETTPSPVSNVATIAAVPSVAPTFAVGSTWPSGSHTPFSGSLKYAYVYTDGTESPLSPASAVVALGSTDGWDATVPSTQPAGVASRRLFMSINGGSTYTRFANLAYTDPSSFSNTNQFDTGFRSLILTAAGSPSATTKYTIPLTVPVSPLSNVTNRKLYRRFNGSGTFKLVTTLNNVVTAYNDTTANAGLGANAPSVNTATANQIAVRDIPIGASGVTSRELFMSAAGGGARKRALAIANNTATTGTITMSDATLAGEMAEPSSDTSGLAQPEGQVLPGSTEIEVAGASVLPPSGWAVIGNGAQVIRYTGNAGTELTGVPTSGIGAITAAVSYNSTITAAPMLTGIPPSGDGSILYAIVKGDDLNLFITEDDTDAQDALAAALGSGDGIVEEFIQDRRLTETEIRTRAQAVLAQRAHIDASITYAIGGTTDVGCRDHRSGRTIRIVLSDMNVDDSFKIQRVRISNFQPALEPVFDVEASTNRFSFEDLLRLARRNDGATP